MLTPEQITAARQAVGYSDPSTPEAGNTGSFADYLGIPTTKAAKTPSQTAYSAPGANLPVSPILQPLTQIIPNITKGVSEAVKSGAEDLSAARQAVSKRDTLGTLSKSFDLAADVGRGVMHASGIPAVLGAGIQSTSEALQPLASDVNTPGTIDYAAQNAIEKATSYIEGLKKQYPEISKKLSGLNDLIQFGLLAAAPSPTLSDVAKQIKGNAPTEAVNYVKGTGQTMKNVMGDSDYVPEPGMDPIATVKDNIIKGINESGRTPVSSATLNELKALDPREFSSVDSFVNAATKVVQQMETHPGILKTAVNAIETAATGALESTRSAIESVPKKFMEAFPGRDPESIKADYEAGRREISQRYDKAVRPSVASSRTPQFEPRKMEAIDSIVRNKESLQLIDKNGETVTGRTPQSLNEFKQALDQTKGDIFREYDAKQKAAGGKGATVPLNPVVENLRQIQSNLTVTDLSPDIARYAGELADAFELRGEYATQQAQEAIAHLNKSLESFYKNPTYEATKKVTIDAMVANLLREGLDKTIETTEGPGYQMLKNRYGALKSIEKDLNNRAIVDARKNAKGLLDFSDILTGADALKAVLTMNPAEMARAGFMRALKEYYKYLNNPDTQVAKLFNLAERYPSNTPEPSPFTQLALPPGTRGQGSETTGAPMTVFPREGGQLDITGKNPVVVPPERATGSGNAPIDAERMSLAETAATQAEKEAIQELTPEEVQMLNKITNKAEKAQLVKDYLNQRKSLDSAQSNTANAASINKNAIPDTLPSVSNKSSLPKFQGYKDLTNKTLDALTGKTTVNKNFITDTLKQDSVKEAERKIVTEVLKQYEGVKTIPVQEFADKVKAELLPLEIVQKNQLKSVQVYGENPFGKYEDIALPRSERGSVKKYDEHIYQSPIKTSAGEVHWPGTTDNYFGHTRVEDMAPIEHTVPRTGENTVKKITDRLGNTKYELYTDGKLVKTTSRQAEAQGHELANAVVDPKLTERVRRVIEVQSDLYQKGNLEKEFENSQHSKALGGKAARDADRATEVQKLQQYNNPSAHFRMANEEVKQAAKDGITKLQFPTGETAMKIEGLGTYNHWQTIDPSGRGTAPLDIPNLKVGMEAWPGGQVGNDTWIITDVLGDGKFKAISKDFSNSFEVKDGQVMRRYSNRNNEEMFQPISENLKETFDISGKIDTSNPIYKFYESTLGKYLQKTYKAYLITDPQGVKWFQVDVPKDAGSKPVQARKDTKKRNLA